MVLTYLFSILVFNSFVLGVYVWRDQRRDGARERGEECAIGERKEWQWIGRWYVL